MNTLIFLVTLSSASQQGAKAPVWLESLHRDAISIVGSGRIVGNYTPDDVLFKLGDEGRFALAKRQGEFLLGCEAEYSSLISQGRLLEATLPLLECLKVLPYSETSRLMLADIYFELHQPRNIYVVLAPELDWMGGAKGPLRASLAVAMLGKVFAGQKEYLIENILSSTAKRTDFFNALPTGASQRDIVLLSLLAIGMDESGHGNLGQKNMELYLRYAAGMDWGNSIVAYLLGTVYVREGRNIEAEIYLAPAIDRSTGWLKEENERLLRKARGE